MGLGVRVSGLRYTASGVEILGGVNAGFPEREITCVVGPSGAGKSTLLRAVNRLIEPTAGEVYLDGSPTSGMDPLVHRRRVGMVFQLPTLFGDSVEGAILYGVRLTGKDADAGRSLEMVASTLLSGEGIANSLRGAATASLDSAGRYSSG